MISLITTILNEKDNLAAWLASIMAQSVVPDEIVIVDGGSTDGTWEMLQAEAAKNIFLVIAQAKGNISQGRNQAIRLAKGEVIVATDAGCTYDNHWFEKISQAFAGGAQAAATGFGPWLTADDSLKWYLFAAATTPAPREFSRDWLPSSRSFGFRKELWQKARGYPEWIPICEDVIFDLVLKKQGVVFSYIRGPLVFWRPRATWRAYARQLFRYTRSDGHGKLWLNRQLIRYGVYLGSLALVFLIFRGYYFLIFFLLFGLAVYLKKFWLRFWFFSQAKSAAFRWFGLLLIPVVIVVGDLAKMAGWPVGVLERLSGKIKFENY